MGNSPNGDFQPSDTMTFESEFQSLSQRIHCEFVDKLDLSRVGDLEGESLRREVRRVVEQACDSVCHKEKTLLNRYERERIVEDVLDETFGLGPLEILLQESRNCATLIKGPREVYVMREEQKHRTNVTFRDKEHLKFVASQPCLVCGRSPAEAHHLRFAQPRAIGRKVSDEWTVPLCATHHRALHAVGDEKRWWKECGIEPIGQAERL